MIEILPFSNSHLSGVIDVILPIQQKEFGIDIELQDQPDLLDIQNVYQKENGNFWVAVTCSEVIGTISLIDIGEGQGALRKMFVKNEFRGPVYAVAEKLLKILLKWCHANDMNKIFLGTTPQFLAAHRFYEKHGFFEIRKSELPASFPVMTVDTKFYQYTIADTFNN